jgi:hypothetical protein
MYNALLVPGYLNSNPKLHTDDPENVMYPFKEKHLWIKKSTWPGYAFTTMIIEVHKWL